MHGIYSHLQIKRFLRNKKLSPPTKIITVTAAICQVCGEAAEGGWLPFHQTPGLKCQLHSVPWDSHPKNASEVFPTFFGRYPTCAVCFLLLLLCGRFWKALSWPFRSMGHRLT